MKWGNAALSSYSVCLLPFVLPWRAFSVFGHGEELSDVCGGNCIALLLFSWLCVECWLVIPCFITNVNLLFCCCTNKNLYEGTKTNSSITGQISRANCPVRGLKKKMMPFCFTSAFNSYCSKWQALHTCYCLILILTVIVLSPINYFELHGWKSVQKSKYDLRFPPVTFSKMKTSYFSMNYFSCRVQELWEVEVAVLGFPS